MNKITHWIFHLWYVKKFNEVKDVPFKMKMGTDSIKSNCILEIENEIELRWLSIKGLLYKLGVKSIQNLRARIHRDDFGKQALSHNPVFSANQIADIVGKYWLYLGLLIGFCTAEAFLYKLTASLFIPGGGQVMYISISVLFAVGVMLGLSFGFDTHFKYRDVIERHTKKELADIELVKYRDMRNIGYFIMVICFAAIVVSGFARIYFMEYVPSKGLSRERVESITRASKMASIFSMLFTILIAFVMAMIKRDLAKVSNRYRVYREWHNAHVNRNAYTQSVIQNANRIILITERSIEKYWQLVIDLKRIYKMDREYDKKYEDLHSEYVLLKAQPGFHIDEHIYGKYAVIQCAYEELFKYGVLTAKEVKDKIDFALEILKVPKDHLIEHLEWLSLSKKDESPPIHSIPATNGKVKENDFFTN